MSSIKIKRIESELCKVISEILLEEARDKLMHTIVITGAEVSSDLSYAKVYFTSLSEVESSDLEKEMEEASPFIRSVVAEKMDLRHTPKLKFVYDTSIAYGSHIESILSKLHEKEEK